MSRQPLTGKRIVVTRAAPQAAQLAQRFEELGANAIICPTIEIVAPASWSTLDACLERIRGYDWLIFTSVNGVLWFLRRLESKGLTLECLKNASVAAIGPVTRHVAEERGLTVTHVPSRYQAEYMVEELGPLVQGCSILLPRSEEAREMLPIGLEKAGARVDVAPAYTTRPPPQLPENALHLINEGQIDCVTFTSSSAAKNLFRFLDQRLLERKQIACIGAVTADTVRELGLDPEIIALEQTTAGLIQAIIQFYSAPQGE